MIYNFYLLGFNSFYPATIANFSRCVTHKINVLPQNVSKNIKIVTLIRSFDLYHFHGLDSLYTYTIPTDVLNKLE